MSHAQLAIDDAKVDVALCADTMASIGKFVEDLQTGVSFQSKPFVIFPLLSLHPSDTDLDAMQSQGAVSETDFEAQTGEEDAGGSSRFVAPSSSVCSTPSSSFPAPIASVDPAAFEQAPPLQDYPEILDDDVPTNLDYLADALNQTLRRPKPHGRGGSSSSQAQGVLISEVDGETIRMLRPKGIEIVDEWLSESRVDAKDVKYALFFFLSFGRN